MSFCLKSSDQKLFSYFTSRDHIDSHCVPHRPRVRLTRDLTGDFDKAFDVSDSFDRRILSINLDLFMTFGV